MISREEILRRGYVDVKVFVTGLRQSHRLTIEREKTIHGMVPFLVCKFYIPTTELVRLAEELQLPVKHKDVVVFPKGMMPSTIAEKSAVVATAEADVIEAEIEE